MGFTVSSTDFCFFKGVACVWEGTGHGSTLAHVVAIAIGFLQSHLGSYGSSYVSLHLKPKSLKNDRFFCNVYAFSTIAEHVCVV